MVCTLIDNDTRHHSGQNVVDSWGAENAFPEREREKGIAWHIRELNIWREP